MIGDQPGKREAVGVPAPGTEVVLYETTENGHTLVM